MTRGSNAAIPAGDDAWDARADAAFLQALPVILAEVFAEHRSEGLTAAICAGGEELVLDVTLTLQAFDRASWPAASSPTSRPAPSARTTPSPSSICGPIASRCGFR